MNRNPSIFDRYGIVKQVPIFSRLSWFDIQKIARKVVVVEFAKGEVICRQEDPSDAFYCLVSGRIQSYTVGSDGSKDNVDFIRRGMHFGVVPLLAGETHSLTYEAVNDSVVLKIDHEDFQAILKSIPQMGIALSEGLSKKIHSEIVKSKTVFERTIISVYSPVKTTGSSTYAFNLAMSLHKETGKSVVFVNIDNFQKEQKAKPGVRSASPCWKKEAVRLNEIIDDHQKIIQSVSHGDFKIDLLNVSFDPRDESLVNQMSQFVTALVQDYHYVVVDLPNEMDEVVLKTLTQSDIIQLVTLDRKEDLQMTRQVIYQLEEQLKGNFDVDKVQVLVSSKRPLKHFYFEEINKEIDYDVYEKLPRIDTEDLSVAVDTGELSVMIPSDDNEYARKVRIIARRIGDVLVGLVLGGGAALGIAHIGILRVFEEEKIPVDVIVGSSMGALIGSLWVTGNNADVMEKIAYEFQDRKSMLKLFDPVVPVSGLVGGKAIRRWLRRKFKNKIFYHTEIPLKIVAYDLLKRREIVLDSGSIVDAVHKSAAIPGVIAPVIEREKVVIDGGVLNPLPTNVLKDMGIKKIIAVNVLQSPGDVEYGYQQKQEQLRKEERIPFLRAPGRYLKFRMKKKFMEMFTPNIPDIIVNSLQASEYEIAQQSAKHADILIHPDLAEFKWYELYKVAELIKKGEEAARRNLPQIKALVKS
ncbi:MAG: patatin-like phospholipase family protein [Candidatus Omnitrophica bacterium]|nr:patatin-like phospholipase family protein [Candidatus Omnitrophota bacterium]